MASLMPMRLAKAPHYTLEREKSMDDLRKKGGHGFFSPYNENGVVRGRSLGYFNVLNVP